MAQERKQWPDIWVLSRLSGQGDKVEKPAHWYMPSGEHPGVRRSVCNITSDRLTQWEEESGPFCVRFPRGERKAEVFPPGSSKWFEF